MYWLVLYDKNTGQIKGYFSNSSNYLPTRNVRNLDPEQLALIRLKHPPFEVSLDHKLIIVNGKIVDSLSSPRLNPPKHQPEDEMPDWKQEWQEAQQRGTDAKLDLIARRLGLS